MIPQDPHISASIAGLMGGFLWGLAQIFKVVLAPTPPKDKRTVEIAYYSAAASVLSAGIGDYYAGPAILQTLHLTKEDLGGLLEVLIGMGFWQSIPAIVKLTEWAMLGWLGKLLGTKEIEQGKTDERTTV